jgi:hypothetical protein
MCSYLQNSLDSAAKNIYNQRIAPVEKSLPSLDEVLTRICTEPRFVTVLSSYFVVSSQAMKRVHCDVTGVSQASFPEYLSMPIAKGCPYTRIMNYKYVALVHVVLIRCSSRPSVSEEHLLDWSCLSVRLIQLENRWTDLDEIWYGSYATGVYSKIVRWIGQSPLYGADPTTAMGVGCLGRPGFVRCGVT